jgi:hypothetical protein
MKVGETVEEIFEGSALSEVPRVKSGTVTTGSNLADDVGTDEPMNW